MNSLPAQITRKNGLIHIQNYSALDLIREYGSPLRISYPEQITVNYNFITQAWTHAATTQANDQMEFECGYAIKANHTYPVVSTAAKATDFIETSSFNDLRIVEKIVHHLDGKKIICNGFKPAGSRYLEKIIELQKRGFNIIPVIDNAEELDELNKLSTPLTIGIRIAAKTTIKGRRATDRFGVTIDTFRHLSATVSKNPNLTLTLLHMHVPNTMKDAAERIEQLTDLFEAAKIARKDGHTIDYIDCGGGLPEPSDETAVLYETYFSQIIKNVSHLYGNTKTPRIIVECGRALVANIQCLLVSAVTEKKLNDDVSWYILDTSAINTLPELMLDPSMGFNIEPVAETSDSQLVICGGITCDPEDYFNTTPILLPHKHDTDPLALIITSTGAYQESINGAGSALPGHCLISSPRRLLLHKNSITVTEESDTFLSTLTYPD